MTTRHQPLSRQDAAPAPAQRQSARLRWFLVAHVLAVLIIYATALVVGGGLAATPFPSSRQDRTAAPATLAAPASLRMPAPADQGPRQALVLPAAAPDLAPPWAQEGVGAPRAE